MVLYNVEKFSTLNYDGFDTKGILVSNKPVNELKDILEKAIKEDTRYDNNLSFMENESNITLQWVNYGFPDRVGLKWVTPKFKEANRVKLMNSNDPIPLPRITFDTIKTTKDLNYAIVVNHIQGFCTEKTKYDIKAVNGLYKQFNNIIDFGVIVVFCF